MNFLGLDFETYWDQDYTLSKMTTESYVRDPRFKTVMVALRREDWHRGYWEHPDMFRYTVAETDWDNTIMVCHHAHFDGLILQHHYGVQPAMYIDTMTLARIIDGPKAGLSLAKVCERHGVAAKLDYLEDFKGKHYEELTYAEVHRFATYAIRDIESTWELAMRWIPTIPDWVLRLIDIKTKFFTDPVFVGNTALLARGIVEERERKFQCLARAGGLCGECDGNGGFVPVPGTFEPCPACDGAGVNKKIFSSSDKFAELLRAYGVEPPAKVSPTHAKKVAEAQEQGLPPPPPKIVFAFAKSDPGMQELLEDEDEEIRFLAEARVATKSTLTATRSQRFHDCSLRGLMTPYVKPHGAHTHRSSSGDGTNYQNLTSNSKTAPERLLLKQSVEAPEGCTIVACDSGQIQARLAHWFFGQQDMVQAFIEADNGGLDVYSRGASTIYQRPVDRKRFPDRDFVEGQVGKITELSFIFGQGWFQAARNFLKGHLGAPPIRFTQKDMDTMGIDPLAFYNNPHYVQQVQALPSRLQMGDLLIHCAVTKGIVDRWRQKNDKVTAGWKDPMDRAIRCMAEGVEWAFGPGGCVHTVKDGIVAPSGLVVHYKDVHESFDENGQSKGYSYFNGRTREKIYGGALTNNVIQLLEQEIIGQAIVQVADLGYKVALECYDSIVCVVPDAYAEQCMTDMKRIMVAGLPWSTGLPLAVDGGTGRTYLEAK